MNSYSLKFFWVIVLLHNLLCGLHGSNVTSTTEANVNSPEIYNINSLGGLKNGKEFLQNEIQTKENVSKDLRLASNDFSLASIENQRDIIGNITLAISKEMDDFAAWHYQTQQLPLIQNMNFTALQKLMRESHQTLKNLTDVLTSQSKNCTSTIQFSTTLKLYLAEMGYTLPASFEKFMGAQNISLNFNDSTREQILTPTSQIIEVGIWTEPIFQLLARLGNSMDWYEFCVEVEKKVNSYGWHAASSGRKFNRKAFTDWLHYIESNNVIPVNDYIMEIKENLRREELQILDRIMEFSVVPTKWHCSTPEPDAIIVQGNFVILSKILSNVQELRKKCPKATKIQIYSAHTVYVGDLKIFLADLDLIIIAPNWFQRDGLIIDITLTGRDGSNYSSPAVNGNPGTGYSGQDGFGGTPGSPGGSLFGISGIIKADSLTVTSQGGKGGDGQNGGNGGSGVQTRNANPRDDYMNYYTSFCNSPCYPVPCTGGSYEPFRCRYHYGFYGGDGGSGGNGGARGKSGLPGSMKVLQLRSNVTVTSYITILDGRPGSGGLGGEGGNPGKGSVCECDRARMLCPNYLTSWPCYEVEAFHGVTKGQNGRNGTTGTSTASIQPPKPARLLNFTDYITQYRIFTINTTHPVTIQFLAEINSNPELEQYYTIKAFANEAYEVEKVRETANPNRLIATYNYFIQRLERYLKTKAKDNEEKKVTYILLSASYSSLMSLKVPPGSTTVLDIAAYFETLSLEITKLEQSVEKDAAAETVAKARDNFKKDLTRNIEQALRFIDTHVSSAVVDAATELKSVLVQYKAQLEKIINDESLSLSEIKQKIIEAEIMSGFSKYIAVFKVVATFAIAVCPEAGPGVVAATSALDSITKLAPHVEDLDKLEKAKEEIERLLKDTIRKEKEFEEKFLPLINSTMSYLITALSSLRSGDHITAPSLDMTSWNLTTSLKEAKNALVDLLDGTLKTTPLANAFDRIQDAVTLIISLYKDIDHYLETDKLVEYIATLATAEISGTTISDKELARLVGNYEKKLKGDVLAMKTKHAMEAFKQWVFPFAIHYISTNDLPRETEIWSLNYGSVVKNLAEKLKEYNEKPLELQDTFIRVTNFSSEYKTSRPFFVWRKEEHEQDIEKLMGGTPVSFYADVRQMKMAGREAVKFRLVEINFKLNSSDKQEDFNKLLNSFGVNMTHGGLSRYRFQENYYAMAGESVTLKYDFERNSDGNRLGTNLMYEKFKRGDLVLSPYTMWTFQVFYDVPNSAGVGNRLGKNEAFEALKKYSHLVDLELVGAGTYVEGENVVGKVGDLQLEKYYERDDVMRKKSTFGPGGSPPTPSPSALSSAPSSFYSYSWVTNILLLITLLMRFQQIP